MVSKVYEQAGTRTDTAGHERVANNRREHHTSSPRLRFPVSKTILWIGAGAIVVLFALTYFFLMPVAEVATVLRGTAISAIYGTVRIEPAFVVRVRAQNDGFIRLAEPRTWRLAGFDPTTKPLTDDYFTAISDPKIGAQVDLFWSNWAPAWASASTVLQPLFDSSINLTSAGPGRDYGYWADKKLDAQMAKVQTIADRAARERAWTDVDTSLLSRGAYIGLAERRALYIAGSDVRNLSANSVNGGVVEFGDIAVVR